MGSSHLILSFVSYAGSRRAGWRQGNGDMGMLKSDSSVPIPVSIRFQIETTWLLSPNWSISTPMRWAMRRSRLLMWASEFTGRLQT